MTQDPPQAHVFRYQRPETIDSGKKLVLLGRSDLMIGGVQVLRDGGENNLHAHSNMDGFWFVLSGRVRFYTEGDELVADLGPHEGVLVPRRFPYWFESVGDEGAELLQVESFSRPITTNEELSRGRIDYAARKAPTLAMQEDVRAAAGTGQG